MPAHPSATAEPENWIACPECGASCLDRKLSPGTSLRCKRCGITVKRYSNSKTLQPAWAFATAGLFLAALANVTPILTFDVVGNTQSNHIFTGVIDLYQQGYWPVAALVCFAGILGPIMHLAAIWYVLSACCLSIRWPGLRRAAHAVELLEQWNLMPVYAVATVVAVVKLDMLGTVDWQQGAFWVLLLSLFSLLAMQFFDRTLVEKRLEELI